ncbi:MAG: hypothetical protein A2V98_03415 [Planctomycetes bacterium RBG_16_64_12]|nr:MAG: hypothetical protein A2V98_03415 [Planctomycetes bacterium RBG_16_64_12]
MRSRAASSVSPRGMMARLLISSAVVRCSINLETSWVTETTFLTLRQIEKLAHEVFQAHHLFLGNIQEFPIGRLQLFRGSLAQARDVSQDHHHPTNLPAAARTGTIEYS